MQVNNTIKYFCDLPPLLFVYFQVNNGVREIEFCVLTI